MKKLFRTVFATFLSGACLLSAAACANKSECNAQDAPATLPDDVEIDERMAVDENTDCPDCPTCPEEPDANPCPDCPDCPTVPEDPDQGKDKRKDGDRKSCPYPHHRRARFQLLPFEIMFGETEEGFYYVFLPAVQ